MSRKTELRWLAALFLAAGLLYSVGMRRAGFEGKDERRYAQAGKEISVRSGLDFFVPHYLGEFYPDKPPLLFWAEALSYQVFGGVSPAAARFPLFLFTMLALAFAYLLMRQLDGPRLALIGVAALALSFRFLWAGRWVKLDMPMCAFTYGAFWTSARIFFPTEQQKEAGIGWALGGWLLIGGAILSKGPGAIVWVGAILAFAAFRRDVSVLKRQRFFLGLLAAACVAGVWLVPAMAFGGPEYYQPLFGVHVVERLIGQVRHGQPFWYFGPKLLSDSLPTGLLLIAGAWLAWRSRNDGQDGGRAVFLLCWVGFTLVFFSLPAGKRGQYILPLYPAAALLAARFIDRGLSAPEGGWRKALCGHLWVLAAVLLMGGIAALFLGKSPTDEFPATPPPAMLAMLFLGLAGGGAAGAALLWKGRPGSAAAACAAGIYLAYLALFGIFFPLNRDDSAPIELARWLEQNAGADYEFALFDEDYDRYALYGPETPRVFMKDRDRTLLFMNSGGNVWLLAEAEDYQKLVAARGQQDWLQARRWLDEEMDDEMILLHPAD